jgi:hypothetical protein
MHAFVAEVDGKPIIAFQAKNKVEARAFVKRDSVQQEIRAMKRGGMPVCDKASDLHIRAANPVERRRLAMSMLSIGLLAKRIELDFWISLISTQI